MREIELTQNQFALVDDEDFNRICQYTWCASRFSPSILYAQRHIDKYTTQLMHSFILNSTRRIDHEDHDGLNNQKYNLRFCTQSQNIANSRIQKNKTSKYKGVYKASHGKKWAANIKVNYKIIYLGSFLNEEDAALAYNNAAIKYFGEFAFLNGV